MRSAFRLTSVPSLPDGNIDARRGTDVASRIVCLGIETNGSAWAAGRGPRAAVRGRGVGTSQNVVDGKFHSDDTDIIARLRGDRNFVLAY